MTPGAEDHGAPLGRNGPVPVRPVAYPNPSRNPYPYLYLYPEALCPPT